MAEKVPRGAPRPGMPERLQVTFATSAASLVTCPAAQGPEVAFAGRSNSGKSSVLNSLTGSRSLARVSKTPGRTQLLNFFTLAGGGYLVDLPGYGYAKAGKARQAQWQATVNDYLSRRDALAGLVLVTDIRHPDQPFDRELLEWADASGMPVHVLLNKADKLGYGAGRSALARFTASCRDRPLVTAQTFSALKGTGVDELVCKVLDWAEPPAAD